MYCCTYLPFCRIARGACCRCEHQQCDDWVRVAAVVKLCQHGHRGPQHQTVRERNSPVAAEPPLPDRRGSFLCRKCSVRQNCRMVVEHDIGAGWLVKSASNVAIKRLCTPECCLDRPLRSRCTVGLVAGRLRDGVFVTNGDADCIDEQLSKRPRGVRVPAHLKVEAGARSVLVLTFALVQDPRSSTSRNSSSECSRLHSYP